MQYLNVPLDVLRSDAFRGAEPVDRATWLALLAYAADQENGGVIAGAAGWKDRKLQQVLAVTSDELHRQCSELWEIDGDDVVVHHYPVVVESMVNASRRNGSKGGRPTKIPPADAPEQPTEATPLPGDENPAETQGKTQPEPRTKPRAKRNGREGKGRECKGTVAPPTPPLGGTTTTASVLVFPTPIDPDIHPDDLIDYGLPAPHSPRPDPHPRWTEYRERNRGRAAGLWPRFVPWLSHWYPTEASALIHELRAAETDAPDDDVDLDAVAHDRERLHPHCSTLEPDELEGDETHLHRLEEVANA